MTLRPMLPGLALALIALAVSALSLAAMRYPADAENRRRWILRIGLFALLFVALVRPTISDSAVPRSIENVDVFLLVDRSGSMNAEDFGARQPRIDGVRAQLTELAAASSGARFSMIGFSDKAHLMLPLTDNSEAVANALQSFTLEDTLGSRGSSIDAGHAMLRKMLQRNHDRYGDQRRRLIVYVGDGEQNSGQAVRSFADLGRLADGGYVLGYGTSRGGPMKSTSALLGAEARKYPIGAADGSPAVSRLNEKNLRKIASELGASYRHMTAESDVRALANALRSDARGASGSITTGHGETYWLPMGAVAILVALELVLLCPQSGRRRRSDASS